MKTDGGWITVSETARLYDKSRKWVYDRIDRYGLDAQKEGNRTRLRLVDLIAHRGEPQKRAPDNSATHTEKSQKITPHTIAHLKQSSSSRKISFFGRGSTNSKRTRRNGYGSKV